MKDNHWKTYEVKIQKRISDLSKNNFFFEIVFLFSNILEVELKHLIDEHQKACGYILNNEKIKFNPKKFFDSDKKTLGELKKYASSFIKSKDVLRKIEDFNKLRIKTVHVLFNQNLKSLEQEIKWFTPNFYKLMENLVDIRISIIVGIQKYKRKELLRKYKK